MTRNQATALRQIMNASNLLFYARLRLAACSEPRLRNAAASARTCEMRVNALNRRVIKALKTAGKPKGGAS